MQAQTHTIAFSSIETIAAMIQPHIASVLLAMVNFWACFAAKTDRG
jgi:hypothetical protein